MIGNCQMGWESQCINTHPPDKNEKREPGTGMKMCRFPFYSDCIILFETILLQCYNLNVW